MKKLVLSALLLALLLCLCACGDAQQNPPPENPAEPQSPETVEETSPPNDLPGAEETAAADAIPFPEIRYTTVDTPYGSLQFPETYLDSLTVTEGEGEIYNLIFSADVGGKGYPLFTVYIGGEPDDVMYFGQVTDENGTVSDVYIQPHDLGDLSGLQEEEQDQLYSMQEALNELLQ